MFSCLQAAVEAKQVLLRQAYKQATEAEAQCKQLQQKLHDALERSRCANTLALTCICECICMYAFLNPPYMFEQVIGATAFAGIPLGWLF